MIEITKYKGSRIVAITKNTGSSKVNIAYIALWIITARIHRTIQRIILFQDNWKKLVLLFFIINLKLFSFC